MENKPPNDSKAILSNSASPKQNPATNVPKSNTQLHHEHGGSRLLHRNPYDAVLRS